MPRHPSQLYEAALEGAGGVRGAGGRRRARARCAVPAGSRACSALLYAVARTFCEFYRDPDPRLEDLGGGLTMGMLLSAPMALIGLALIAYSFKTPRRPHDPARQTESPMIRAEGPISVERYMELALAHPDYGYYMNRDPFGASGDFTTAPEISQMFGELIGLWAAEVWVAMGSPNPVRLIELGPGRGTLMSDALRAARIVPEFRAAIDVTLVETSPTLAEIQHETLLTSGSPIAWAASLAEAPRGPGDRHRQRISRRAAGAPICAARRALARAARRARRARRASPSSVAREAELAIPPPARRATFSRSTRPPSAGVRTRRPARAPGRRGAVHRLRPRLRPASATRCRRCGSTARSIRSPIPARRI